MAWTTREAAEARRAQGGAEWVLGRPHGASRFVSGAVSGLPRIPCTETRPSKFSANVKGFAKVPGFSSPSSKQ